MTKEIETLEDIQHLVDTFYTKIRKDEILGPIFNNKIQDQWPQHLEKMYRFWQTVLLDEHTYFGSPFLPHAQLPVQKEHFNQWILLFFNTLDENFHGTKAEKAKKQGERMAEMFQLKINYYRENSFKPLI